MCLISLSQTGISQESLDNFNHPLQARWAPSAKDPSVHALLKSRCGSQQHVNTWRYLWSCLAWHPPGAIAASSSLQQREAKSNTKGKAAPQRHLLFGLRLSEVLFKSELSGWGADSLGEGKKRRFVFEAASRAQPGANEGCETNGSKDASLQCDAGTWSLILIWNNYLPAHLKIC